ncbi:Subtilisin NAT precursor [Cedecea davisae]|uniref:Peptidase, S8/S53 family n=1 Tax=Cedecea davisae DSM 4568 TaxID=566551 RepID=S3J6N3_9ENTR|nr:S8 family serine peptidase [Cedecea davisae]EPF15687.1 peptidase, S8/S53 family [Cedecea davisae DSM 4568]SUX38437.1 Subtilisin NAT precursor [Cedecea davisae]
MEVHEIYLEIDPKIDSTLTIKKIESTLNIKFKIQKVANSDLVRNVIKKHNAKLSAEYLNILFNGYKLYFDDSHSRTLVKNQVNILSAIPGVSAVKYSGQLVSCAENYSFPTLASQPENNPSFYDSQHLFSSPLGLDAMYGWTLEGGNGKGMNVFITEFGYGSHPDIDFTIIGKLPGGDSHPLQISGIIAARNNDISCIGIIPDASLYISWLNNFDGVLQYGKAGDTISISVAYQSDDGVTYCPWPAERSNLALIALAAEMGITVCYAASNEGVDLDNVTYDGKYAFNKNHQDYIDPKGVCVGGYNYSYSLEPIRSHNYGSFVDVFAQSVYVTTLLGTNSISGTSFSTPMIAALIAQIQSIHISKFGYALPPLKIRELISNPENGITAKVRSPYDKAVMPDLRKVLGALNIYSKTPYPENYGVTVEEINRLTETVNSVFTDDSHTTLVDNITMKELRTTASLLYDMKPCVKKIELLQWMKTAVDLYVSMQHGELLEETEFSNASSAWSLIAKKTTYTENGAILDGVTSGVIGAMYRRPIEIDSKYNYQLSVAFDVLEWDDSGLKEGIIGGYLPQVDGVKYPRLTTYTTLTQDSNVIDMVISGESVSSAEGFPGMGVKGAKKILLKKISLIKKEDE